MNPYAMPVPGDVVAGKYRLEKVVGEGGMGVVYAAQHLVLKQRVAVKVLLPDAATSDHVVERFAREAQAAARIMSEHVARVMDAGSTANGAPFLVMEYLEGCDLQELLAIEGSLPATDVVDYLLQALEALAHAHAVGIVHRDIKPANLFLACRADGGNVIKVLDFGISKTVRSRPEDRVLTGQAVLGSPVYMSPEQLRNAKNIDARADIWSLGVVAYELLAGKPPFDGDGVGEIFAAILESEPVPLHVRNARVSPELSAVLMKCMQRKAEDRWRDAAEFAKAIGPFGSGTVTPLSERAEQILVRAKRLEQLDTPYEARRVVAALDEAVKRARETADVHKAQALLDLTRGETNDRNADKEGFQTRAQNFVRRNRTLRWAGGAALVAAVLAVVASRPKAAPSIDPSRSSANGVLGLPDVTPSDVALHEERADEEGAAPAHAASAKSAPMVVDFPDTSGQTGAVTQSRQVKPTKPRRPKFLNSRE